MPASRRAREAALQVGQLRFRIGGDVDGVNTIDRGWQARRVGETSDDGLEIGVLACSLLDRALADRPGALRLVGVGVSGLSDFRQLAFSALSGADDPNVSRQGSSAGR